MKKKEFISNFDKLKAFVEEEKNNATLNIRKTGDPDDLIFHTGYEDASGTVLNSFNNIFLHNLKTKDGKTYSKEYILGIIEFYREFYETIDKLFKDE